MAAKSLFFLIPIFVVEIGILSFLVDHLGTQLASANVTCIILDRLLLVKQTLSCIFSGGHSGNIIAKVMLLSINELFWCCLSLPIDIISQAFLCHLLVEEVLISGLQLDGTLIINSVCRWLRLEEVLC